MRGQTDTTVKIMDKVCYFVDLDGEIIKTTIGKAASNGLMLQGSVLCTKVEDALKYSERVKMLKLQNNMQDSPFAKIAPGISDEELALKASIFA